MNVLFLLGRIIFGGFFIYGGYNHFSNLTMMSGYAASRGVPAPTLAIAVSGILLLLGGISVLLGLYTEFGLACLIIFLIPVTLTMHSFWIDTDPQMKMSNMVNFTKNMALLGALIMMFMIRRPWPWSILK
jgi:uncharacterized membrane protein YphA (DoxX/SURF4 family)